MLSTVSAPLTWLASFDSCYRHATSEDLCIPSPLDAKADIVSCVADFVDDEDHVFFAGVSTLFKKAWGQRPRLTRAVNDRTTVTQLAWAFLGGLQKRAEVCEALGALGKVELLDCARLNRCSWGRSTCIAAAANGHLRALQFVRAYGCSWSESVCCAAAKGGHMEVLQWARANGCYWDGWTTQMAAGSGHMEILKWAHEVRVCEGGSGGVSSGGGTADRGEDFCLESFACVKLFWT